MRLVARRRSRGLVSSLRSAACACAAASCLGAVLAGVAGPARPRAFAMPLPRRSAALGAGLASLATAADAEDSAAGGSVRLKKTIAENGLEDWKVVDYEAMRDDEPRTQGYEAAIKKRLAGTDGSITVVDIGTGSFALLAIMAARAGARKVYAIEKNAEAAELARKTVEKEKLQDKIEVIEGDSMQVELPEKVDLIVSELIGSIATQEGVEPIIKDATARFIKGGFNGAGGACPQMIPQAVQTQIAPVKYTEHRIMNFAKKRGIMSRGKAADGTTQPLRLRGKTSDLVFLAKPQVLEEFDFCNPGAAASQAQRTLKFKVPAKLAAEAKDFSGFAMWTRLVIDDENAVEVRGQKQTSHWAYVVALMDNEPVAMAAPGTIELNSSIDYAARPVAYTLEADVPV